MENSINTLECFGIVTRFQRVQFERFDLITGMGECRANAFSSSRANNSSDGMTSLKKLRGYMPANEASCASELDTRRHQLLVA